MKCDRNVLKKMAQWSKEQGLFAVNEYTKEMQLKFDSVDIWTDC